MSDKAIQKKAKMLGWVTLVVTFFGFCGSALPYLLIAVTGRGGLQQLARAMHEGGYGFYAVALWNLPAFIGIIVCGVLLVRGRRVPSALLFVGPLITILLAFGVALYSRYDLLEHLPNAAPEQRANYIARGLMATMNVSMLAIVLAAQMLTTSAYCFAFRAWARVAGSRRIWAILVAPALGLSMFVATLVARFLVPGWAGVVASFSLTSSFAFWALIPLVIAISAVTARAPGEQRGLAWRDLVLVVLTSSLAIVFAAQYTELRDAYVAFEALDMAGPNQRFAFLAQGIEIAQLNYWVSLLPLLVILVTLVPALFGLGGGAIGGALRPRVAASIAGVVLLIATAAIGGSLTGRVYQYFVVYVTPGSAYEFDPARVQLPNLEPHDGRGVWGGQIIEVGPQGIFYEGRPLGAVALLDTPQGQAQLREGIDGSINWQRARRSSRRQQHPWIVIAADRSLSTARLVSLLDATAGDNTIEVGLLFEISEQGSVPPPLAEVGPRYGALWFRHGGPPPAAAAALRIESLGTGLRITSGPNGRPRDMVGLAASAHIRGLLRSRDEEEPIFVVSGPQGTVATLAPMLRDINDAGWRVYNARIVR